MARGKALEKFRFLDGYYLLTLDGTGHFSSHKIHCAQCMEKHHQDGTNIRAVLPVSGVLEE